MDGSPQNRTPSAVDRVNALTEEVNRLRNDFDVNRRLPDSLIADFVSADLFRLSVPRHHGGEQLPLRALLGVIEAACAMDASVGWVLTNAALMSRMSGFLSEKVVADWFATPDCMIAGSTASIGIAVPADGGFRVSGIWPFASGIHASSRVMGLCEVVGIEDPLARFVCAFLPIEAVQVSDDWNASGLRGSGSCSFSADGVLIPKEHVIPFLIHLPAINEEPYLLPHLSIFPLSVTMVALGIVKAALADFATLAHRTRGGTSLKLAERELIQTELGRAITLHRAARALVLDALSELEDAFSNPNAERTLPRAFFRAGLAQAGELCERAMSIICTGLGTTSVLESTPIERRQRDLTAAVKHIAMGPHNLTVLGRVHLGLDPGTVRF